MKPEPDDHAPLVEAWLKEPIWLPPSDTARIAQLVEQTPQQRGWLRPSITERVHGMFSAFKLLTAGVIVAAIGIFLVAGGVLTPGPNDTQPAAVTSPEASATAEAEPEREAGPAGLVTEEVEPGVERIIRDSAGHDLDEKHPMYRYDMDRIAIAPDGTVWLTTSYSREDNGAHLEDDDGLVWALGHPGTYPVRYESPPTGDTTYLFVGPDGTKTFTAVKAVASEDEVVIPDIEEVDERLLSESPEQERAVVVARPDGDHTCARAGWAVLCDGPTGEKTFYLLATQINEMVAAPDGTLWVVGGYDDDNGGLYRITLD